MWLNFKYFFSVRKIPENQERLRSWFIVKTTPNVYQLNSNFKRRKIQNICQNSQVVDDHKNNINKHTTDGESDLDIELALADIIIVNCADTDPDTDSLSTIINQKYCDTHLVTLT